MISDNQYKMFFNQKKSNLLKLNNFHNMFRQRNKNQANMLKLMMSQPATEENVNTKVIPGEQTLANQIQEQLKQKQIFYSE